ncbi:uncharacterized protein EI90DRAFT_2886299, partial [Cantharellus anzutake]|uniref:uncharacterized protein n=1 Tax=Cantharellus anzutake TaxID=1750568 RepID=UPI001906C9C0
MESLPTSQLESIRFKLNQTIESIRTLQYSIHADNQPYMLPWPELLSKYNVILTQTHSLMLSVSQAAMTNPATGRKMKNPLPSLAVHPFQPVSEGQMDNALSSLLRMMRLPEVLESDEKTVAAMGGSNRVEPKTDQQVIANMDTIRKEHDYRVERANMAVRMLAEKYNWKRRV